MIYRTGADWQAAKAKRVLLFGMSGLGKTGRGARQLVVPASK